MTDNFKLIEKYMIEKGIPVSIKDAGDLFFNIQLVRRGKDHPNLPAANYTFKLYYIDSIEKMNFFKDEIIKCCEIFGLRAYVSVNVKSKELYSKYCGFKYAQNSLNNEFKKPWAVPHHVFGKCNPCGDKVWIVDVDDVDKIPNIEVEVISTILRCKSNFPNPILLELPTKSGIHVLTRPFNVHDFETFWRNEHSPYIGVPDIKKDHITLLYENI